MMSPVLTAGVGLLVVAAAIYAWALVEYACCSWYANSDIMGASVAFTSLWLIGSMLLSAGLALAAVFGIAAAIAVGFGAAVVGKAIEWFVIEPVLNRLFKNYRRQQPEPIPKADHRPPS